MVTVYQVGREKRYTLTPEPLTKLDYFIKEVGAKWDQCLLRLKRFVENEDERESNK